MTQHIEKMDMAEFENLTGPGIASWQRRTSEAMEINTAVIVTHDGLMCRKDGAPTCSLTSTVASLNAKHGATRRWSVRHLKDGRVAIGCFPAEEG